MNNNINRFNLLALLSICILWACTPLFLPNLFPMHDATTIVGLFHYFYSEFYAYGHLAQWAPYDFYGQPAHFAQLVALSPLSYCAMALGKIFHITNTLVLFKIVMALEVLVFACGLIKLSERFYQSSIAVWFVVIVAMATTIWLTQPFFNFRIYYLWPIIILALMDIVKQASLANVSKVFFWMLISMLGDLPYFAGPWLFAATIFTGVLWLVERKKINFIVTRQGYCWMLLTGLLLVTLFLFLKGLTVGVNLIAPDRSQDATTSVEQFLSYGGTANIGTWFASACGWGDLSLWGLRDIFPYIGLGTVLLALWSMFKVRQPFAIATHAVTILLLLLIFVPLAGHVFYFFPMMKYYRHLSLLIGFAKLFLILSAGFGLDDVLKCCQGKLRYALYGLLVVLMIQMGGYEWKLWSELTAINPKVESLQYVMDVKPLAWQAQRLHVPQDNRTQQALALVQAAGLNGGRFTTDYNFIQFDICNSPWRKDWSAIGVKDMLSINPGFLEMLGGCESLKLRLVPQSLGFNEQAYWQVLTGINRQLIKQVQQQDDLAIALAEVRVKLNSVVMLMGNSTPLSGSNEGTFNVQVNMFNSNNIDIQTSIQGNSGAWLVYADGFHQGWHATVDDKPVKIEQANGAFKAVWVSEGIHQVRFYFFNGFETIASYLLMLFGMLAGVLMGWMAFKGIRRLY